MRVQVLEFTDLSTGFRKLARFSLAAMIIALPFRYRSVLLERPSPPIYKDYTDVLLFASDIFLVATLVFWLLSVGLNRERLKPGPLFLSIPLAGVTGIAFLTSLCSLDLLLSLYHSIRLILLAGLYLYVLYEIKSFDEIVLPVSIQVFIQSIVGIGQTVKQHSLGLKILGELELDPAWQGVSIIWAEGVRSLRAYGLSDHPNILGGCFTLALILIATWYANANSRSQALVVSLFSLGILSLFYTFSRSAWLAFGSGLLFLFIFLLKTRQSETSLKLFFLSAASLILLVPFLLSNLPYLGVRLNYQASFSQVAQENQSIGERALLNQAANTLFANNALTGVGLGTFPLALQKQNPGLPVNYQPAHFALLDVAAETGIFGALFYSLVMVLPWFALWFNRKRLVFTSMLIGSSALLLAVTLIGFFDYYTWLLAPGRLWQWLIWGLWAAAYQSAIREVKNA